MIVENKLFREPTFDDMLHPSAYKKEKQEDRKIDVWAMLSNLNIPSLFGEFSIKLETQQQMATALKEYEAKQDTFSLDYRESINLELEKLKPQVEQAIAKDPSQRENCVVKVLMEMMKI